MPRWDPVTWQAASDAQTPAAGLPLKLYDAKGNLLTTHDAASGVSTNSYDSSGLLQSTQNAGLFTTSVLGWIRSRKCVEVM